MKEFRIPFKYCIYLYDRNGDEKANNRIPGVVVSACSKRKISFNTVEQLIDFIIKHQTKNEAKLIKLDKNINKLS